jgi:hypothetical protein
LWNGSQLKGSLNAHREEASLEEALAGHGVRGTSGVDRLGCAKDIVERRECVPLYLAVPSFISTLVLPISLTCLPPSLLSLSLSGLGRSFVRISKLIHGHSLDPVARGRHAIDQRCIKGRLCSSGCVSSKRRTWPHLLARVFWLSMLKSGKLETTKEPLGMQVLPPHVSRVCLSPRWRGLAVYRAAAYACSLPRPVAIRG